MLLLAAAELLDGKFGNEASFVSASMSSVASGSSAATAATVDVRRPSMKKPLPRRLSRVSAPDGCKSRLLAMKLPPGENTTVMPASTAAATLSRGCVTSVTSNLSFMRRSSVSKGTIVEP